MQIRLVAPALALYIVASQSLAAQAPVSPDSARVLERVRISAERATRRGYSTARSRTATKTDTPLRDTPQSVSAVTGALIADKAMQNMSDVVQYLPGITMAQGESHHDAPVIRGNSTTADFFINGVRDDAQYVRDVYNVERVEAIKGSNAMIFGRGGAGGVINRVTKTAAFSRVRSLSAEGGSFGHARTALDAGGSFGSSVAARLNALYQKSGGFRDNASVDRVGINPTATLLVGAASIVRADYEHFDDRRTVDRGIPSYLAAPSAAPVSQYFGDPGASHAYAHVDGARIVADRQLGESFALRNTAAWGSYDKFYQNVYAGSAVNAAATLTLSAYNNRIRRDNLVNQTDLTGAAFTGAVRHTLLAGLELSRQRTTAFRNTGYFNGTATSLAVPFASASVAAPVTFRQSATDADNRSRADVGALYVQDQADLTHGFQAVAGVRVERFTQFFHNNRTGDDLRRDDRLVSPRVGMVFKPAEPLSLYASSSVAWLPSSGDQFSSLTVTTQTLEPERMHNAEVGAKWDASGRLSLTAAVYRLDRSNSQAPDPVNPGRIVQTGARRTTGVELGASGQLTSAWSTVAGFASQRAVITGTTTTAPAGATIQLVPHTTLSLWNRYDLGPSLGAGIGVVHQGRMYAAIDNTVMLPAFTRWDAGVFATVTQSLRAQLNVENVGNVRYYPTSQGNNNIMPGAPRSAKVSLTTTM